MSSSKAFNRILLIDDDDICLQLNRLILKDMNLAEEIVMLESTGDALDYIISLCQEDKQASEQCPHLIMLDLYMLQRDNNDFLAQLHSLKKSHGLHTKVLMLSTYSYYQEQSKMDAYGLTNFMTKPISQEKMKAFLKKASTKI